MAVTALPLTTKISQSSQKTSKSNILVAKFGDGYEQRLPDGINYKKDAWQIIWDNLTTTEITTVETAIASARWGADYFTWTPFNEIASKKFKYMGHQVTYNSGGTGSINMNIEQVFDL
jgi:phage-related protein